MKKLLSIILAIVMIASMLPSAFAANTVEEYNYVFTNKAFGVTDGSKVVRSTLAEMTLETPLSSVSDKWRVAGSNYLYNVYAQTEGIVWDGYTDNAKNGVSAFAIEISVPTGGTYKPSLSYSAVSWAPIVDVYLVKEGTEAGGYSTNDIKFDASGSGYNNTSSFIKALGDTGKLGQVDLWKNAGSWTNIKTESFNNLELQLDGNSKYYLCFHAAGTNDGYQGIDGYFYANIESFTLIPSEPEPEDELSSFSLSSSSDSIFEGEKVTLKATAVYSVSGSKVMTEGVTYKSSDENILKVSDVGVVTGVSKGTAKITATVDGTSFSDEVEITVKEAEIATEEYNYVFTKAAFGSPEGNYARSKLAEMTLKTPLSSVSDQWRVAGSYYLYNVFSNTEGIVWNAYSSNAYSESAKEGYCAFAVEISVPAGGTYKPSLRYSAITSAPIVDVYLVKEGTEAGGYSTNDIKFAASGNDYGSTYSFIKALGDEFKLGQVDLWGNGSYTNKVTETFNNLERQLDGNGKYYLCFLTVGLNSNHIDWDSTYSYACIESFKLTYVPSVADTAFDYEKEDYVAKETAQVSALAAYGSEAAIVDSEVISVTNVAYGENCTVSVKEETVTKGEKTYKFSHWARGAVTGANKMVLSSELSFSYKPSEGNNILIAVFEEVGAERKEAFYNYNGQLLSDLKIENDKLPSLPSMAGFENPATKWVQMGTNVEFDAGADISEISGDKIFMAKYDAPIADIEITVNGVENTYKYGDTVACTASVPEGKVFMYWTKTVAGKADADIVSLNESYSFSAWEDSVVTAVYGDAKPSFVKEMRKVIISSVAAGNSNAIMAEFIGFDDALEKGIMIGNQKIAMTTDKTQFTIINDTKDTEI